MTTMKLTAANIQDTVGRNRIVFANFQAPHRCNPCRVFEPTWDAAAARHPDIVFAKVDSDNEPRLNALFEIQAVPTVVAIKDGVPVATKRGVQSAQDFADLIRDVRAADVNRAQARPVDPRPAQPGVVLGGRSVRPR